MIAREVPNAGRRLRYVHRNREIHLQPGGATQHLAPNPHNQRARKLAVVPGDQPAKDLRLPAGPDRRHPIRLLERADGVDHLGSAHQEIVHLVVDLVDLAAQVVQGPVRVGHGVKGLSGGR